MSAIPDFDDAERRVIEAALCERYGSGVETRLADVELKLSPGDVQLSSCPTLYWEERGAAFVLVKTAPERYRPMFFYPTDMLGEQYGTGRLEYDDLLDCVMAVLRTQADHEKERQGVTSGTTAEEFDDPREGEEVA